MVRATTVGDPALEKLRRRAEREMRDGAPIVFGGGPAPTGLALIGEAPGEQEERQGLPFVGPAGRLLDQALSAAGIERARVYVTNVVKQRPVVPGSSPARNRAPTRAEIKAWLPWLQEELRLVAPQVIGCLGAVAAKTILGQAFRLTEQRGQWFSTEAAHVLATVHPAYVLKQRGEDRERWRSLFFGDIARLAERYHEVGR